MPSKQHPAAKPYPWLLKSPGIRMLWMLRILTRSSVGEDLFTHPRFTPIRAALKLSVTKNEADSVLSWRRLQATLERLESGSLPVRLPPALNANLGLLRVHFSFDQVDCSILAFAVMLRIDDALFQTADCARAGVNTPDVLASVLGIPSSRIEKALEPGSRLRRSSLIEATSGGDISGILRLRRGGLRKLGLRKFKRVDEIFRGLLVAAPAPSLVADDYAHLKPDLPAVARLIGEALDRGRAGVNVLLYGPPGTGKSELVRILTTQLGVPLFDVADVDEDGYALDPGDRLAGAVSGLFLLGRRKAVVCFDEVEAIFNDGSAFFGKPSTAECQKSFFNRLLERNEVPVFWIANSVHGIDPAFARRFDLVINLESPPRKQRLKLLERECGKLVSSEQLRRLARLEHITPAVVTRASSVVRRVGLGDPGRSEALFETVVDGVLRAQGHAPLAVALGTSGSEDFDPLLCNASENLDALARGLSTSANGRICLYGPPGTGKTAFGEWLADSLGKPLVLKRVSDLQSPLLGVMERNLAQAFAAARRDDAILQIDEVDAFLRDRRQAERPWEVSQVSEFLTQLERFDGLFIASTNLVDNLDPAALRRFDYKIRMDYLRPEQVMVFLERSLDAFGIEPAHVAAGEHLRSRKLTPGDFAVVARRHRVVPFADVAAVVDALCAEADVARRIVARPIGFV